MLWADFEPFGGSHSQQPRFVEKAIEESWKIAEEEYLLLEKDVDAAKKHLIDTDIFFICANRSVGGDKQSIDPSSDSTLWLACYRANNCRSTYLPPLVRYAIRSMLCPSPIHPA